MMSQESSGKHLFLLFIMRIWPLVKLQPRKEKSSLETCAKLLTGHVQPQAELQGLSIIKLSVNFLQLRRRISKSLLLQMKSLLAMSAKTLLHMNRRPIRVSQFNANGQSGLKALN